jgi:hypothetical protein
MSTFPQLEEALEAAARRHYGRRRRRFSWRPFVPAVAVAAAAAAVLIALPDGSTPPAPERPAAAVVPALTLARSHALTRVPLPKQSRTPVAHAALPAVAAELRRSLPYPPGVEDRFDWAATQPGPYNMSSFNYREEVHMLLEFRAGCLWLQYWLAADAAGRAAAATVLADVPDWPYQRRAASRWGEIAAAAARGDAAALTGYERGHCFGM